MTAGEIADRLGMSRRVVNNWRRRYPDFPQPTHEFGRVLVWSWEDVEAWLRATGRWEE